MEQNVRQCEECIKRIKKKLDELGFVSIMCNNNILVKASKSSISNAIKNGGSSVTSNCKCKYNASVDLTSGCNVQATCTVAKTNCPLCNGSLSGSTNTSNGSYLGDYDSLFRIRPSDIQNGLTLSAIMLHGETCELKILFNHDREGEKMLIDTLIFLV